MPPLGPPTRRPPFSVPRQALRVIASFFLVAGSVPALWAMTAGPVFGSSHDLLDDYFPLYLVIVAAFVLGVIFAARTGRLWGLWLLRVAAQMLAAMVVTGLVGNGLLALGAVGNGTVAARASGEFGVIGLLICAPVAWLLLRGLTRVRWLDPRSRPEEWEPPLRRSDVALGSLLSRRYDP